ncbi:HIT family protein [Rhodocyclus gracilis]|uniref:HIT domain-containing protein n=1 Tax=Rhodocyclus tenuis TaxID=1066 RepID=A0A6L5JZE3_RHOTE|nr:HIT family protein [Rhodocyclus gracilis]MQY52441.1 HIT domain-containing protein [Rhodocyclus gracilis]
MTTPHNAPALNDATGNACPLCAAQGETVLWADDFCRVIGVDDADYPGFCRVILWRHVREMSDLAPEEQTRLMRVVFAVESVLRRHSDADKINLASFGNQVPHLHWHIIPRWRDDRHFPDSIWAAPRRSGELRTRRVPAAAALRSLLAIELTAD